MRLFILSLLISFSVLLMLFIIFKPKVVNQDDHALEDGFSIDIKNPTLTQKVGEDNSPITNDDYKIDWITVHDLNNIRLYSNVEEKLTSSEAKNDKLCNYLINAGFITKYGKHIGLFVNSDGKLEDSIRSNTFNGYLSIRDNKSSITKSEPIYSKIALQSGPVLILEGNPLEMNLKSDENARRIVAAVNKNHELMFLAIYLKNSPLSGPKLSDLPEMLLDVEKNTSLDFTNAINLDGGSHSAFLGRSANLFEASIIGGYFCIR